MQMHQSLSQTNHFEPMLGFVKLTQSVIPVATAFMSIEKFRSGRKLGDVGASFSDISRPLLFHLAPCTLLDVADVLSAKIFDSIPVFFLRKKGMPYI